MSRVNMLHMEIMEATEAGYVDGSISHVEAVKQFQVLGLTGAELRDKLSDLDDLKAEGPVKTH